MKLAILGHFLLPKNPKNQHFEKKKKCWRYHHFTHVHQKSRYDVCFLRYQVRWTEFFVILGQFLSFYPPSQTTKEYQNFEKIKNATGDIIISHMCSKNHDHMMYAS